jgi:ABC-2 type transport system permease protein
VTTLDGDGLFFDAPRRRHALTHQLRILRVVARVEFKLKYADSALGYVWSLVKPLSYFAVLWVVFGRFFKLGAVRDYPLYLLLGIVVYTFFVDAISIAMPSIVVRGDILRRLSFPRGVIPVSSTMTAAITFLVNACAVAVFAIVAQVHPHISWLLILPLLVELYGFILGLALILSALFVRFRDVGQVWELAATLLFYATPVMYPVEFLPRWAMPIIFVNPLVQTMQDLRAIIIGINQPYETITSIYGGSAARLIPIGIAIAIFLFGLWFFRRESPRFAERI